MRKPDFIIGNGQLLRWFVIPRNKWFNIYLHHVLRSDEDRAMHDHPWWNLSIVLRGGYFEHTKRGEVLWRGAGSFVLRPATAAHRLVINPEMAPHAWTLFITGPLIRVWGFHCPKGWVKWTDFVDARDSGAVGRGCGEMS